MLKKEGISNYTPIKVESRLDEIKKYHLYRNDYSRLHFQVNDASSYCEKNLAHCYKPHQHSFYQFIWFKEVGQHYVDYEVIKHEPDTLFFLDKGQIHNFCKHSVNEGVLFHFDEDLLHQNDPDSEKRLQQKVFNSIGKPYLKLPADQVQLFEDTTSRLITEMTNMDYNYSKHVYHLFQLLILSVERLKHSTSSIPPSNDKDYQLAVLFKNEIQNNMRQMLNIDQYSDMLGISSKKLTEVSKTYLDDTPLNVVHKRKILEAKRLLSNTSLSIKELAYTLGFDQPTYFTKYFKKHTGLTPKDFIKQAL